MFITISTNVRRNPSNPIIPFMIPESNTFQKILNSNFEFRKYSTFPTNIDIELSIRNKISKDPFTNTSANTTESIDSIKMRTYIILTEKYIVKDYTVIQLIRIISDIKYYKVFFPNLT